MRNWIKYPIVEGISSRQAHCDLPDQTYEREMSKEGFFGPSTQFHHKHPPTSWISIEGDILPYAIDTTQSENLSNHPWQADVLLKNQHCRIQMWKSSESMQQLARNADGDEILFFHQGNAELFCDFGHLSIKEGDYVLIPRGCMWRLEIEENIHVLMIESSNSSFSLPDKGMLGHHAIFDAAMLDTPKIDNQYIAQQNEEQHEIIVKRHQNMSAITYPFNPLDTIGWHGDLTVARINWRDIRPITSHRYHLPPSVHTTFVADRFVICTFCPRPIETDPDALKVPFFHNNNDYDEVLFYHKGNFFSRDNIHPGMMTLHPVGLTHGPHPKALQTGLHAERKTTDEVAVMIDTRDAIFPTKFAQNLSWPDYVNSWQVKNS